MLIFEDIFTNDKVMSDHHVFNLEYNDAIMKVQSKYLPKNAISVLSRPQQGAPTVSADSEEMLEQVIDVVYAYDLVNVHLPNWGDCVNALKTPIGNIRKHLQSNVSQKRGELFMQGVNNFLKFVQPKFNEFEFYMGSSEQSDPGNGC